mmetsp:Transcript_22179/g.48190  ORF Transcript_22179/g.48190 Transcript_22179/m.48190 type:complete len:527 (+) Transcript_22179:309-1889(+)
MVKHAGYERQDGFGWTNGVALYFLSLYQQHCSYVKYQQWTVSDDSDYRHGSEEMTLVEEAFTLSKPRLRRLAKHIEHEMKLGLVGDALSSLAMDVSWVTDHCVASAAVALSRPAQHTLSISASVDRAGITIAWNREGAAGSVANVKKLSCSADWVAASSAKQAVAAIVTALVDGFRAHHLSVEQSYSLSVAWGIPLPSTDLVWSRDIAVPVDASVTPADTRLHLRPALTQALAEQGYPCVTVTAVVATATATAVARAVEATEEQGVVGGVGLVASAHVDMSVWVDPASLKKTKEVVAGQGRVMVVTQLSRLGDKTQASDSVLPRNRFDDELDQSSCNPGESLFGKMTSGDHLAELVRLVLIHLMDQRIIRRIESLLSRHALSTKDVATCVEDDTDNLDAIKHLLAVTFRFKSLRSERRRVREVCDIVCRRAGVLLGTSVAAAIAVASSGKSGQTALPLCSVGVHGALYAHIPALKKSMGTTCGRLLRGDLPVGWSGLRLDYVRDAHVKGALMLAAHNHDTHAHDHA